MPASRGGRPPLKLNEREGDNTIIVTPANQKLLAGSAAFLFIIISSSIKC